MATFSFRPKPFHRKLVAALERDGYGVTTVALTAGNHVVLVAEGAEGPRKLFAPLSASDHRAAQNFLSRARRVLGAPRSHVS